MVPLREPGWILQQLTIRRSIDRREFPYCPVKGYVREGQSKVDSSLFYHPVPAFYAAGAFAYIVIAQTHIQGWQGGGLYRVDPTLYDL